jgi:hypothetical protein
LGFSDRLMTLPLFVAIVFVITSFVKEIYSAPGLVSFSRSGCIVFLCREKEGRG